jgi:glycosyltransferase involved in cell wall biosynthesis
MEDVMAKKAKWIFATACLIILAFFVNYGGFKLKRSDLTVIGPVNMRDGLGRQSVELMDALYDSLKINFIPTREPCLTEVPERIKALIKRSNKKMGKVIVYETALPTPNHKFYKRLNQYLHGPKQLSQIRIAYSMLESSRLPQLWAEGLNSYFDAVAVPDAWLVEAYQKSGVTIPIFVLPLGLNIDPFLSQPLKAERHTPFCFINTSSMIARKNHEGLIRAFHQAFGDDPDVILLMNYRTVAGTTLCEVKELIASLKATNIYLQNETLDSDRYLKFYKQGDVFVSLAKGEGFSIQPREAMALGLPIIISDNTAHKTIVASGLSVAVACPTTTFAHNPYLKCNCGEEYVADIDAAAAAMRKVYNNYEFYLKNAADRRAWASQYRFENCKSYYINLIKPKKVILSDHNAITEEALMTSSAELFQKYQAIAME